MKVVAIKDMVAGNETVGEMWKETKIFELDDSIRKVIDWVKTGGGYEGPLRKNVVITIAEE